ncbi:hypothetical protein GGR56DRAFT_636619 [Xylariaceae sp. FL0804]|nr:hypothetical protein GGR56DRAFT_636619 [Xylariaceae sp. FL0804]
MSPGVGGDDDDDETLDRRVADASVVPVPLSAHIQAPLYAMAEQAAAIIAGVA